METLILVTCIINHDGRVEKGHVLITQQQATELAKDADQVCDPRSPLYVPVKTKKKDENGNG